MDIKCIVCGEPWDAYGVKHGDMLSWEADLFRKGAGCPSCEGRSNGFVVATLADIENGDEDPMDRIVAAENVENGTTPRWERPEDPKHWECDGCGVQVRTDLDSNELVFYCPWGSDSRHNEYEFEKYCEPEKEPAHTFEHGMRVCELCLTSCEKCGAKLSDRVEDDCYADGATWYVANDREHTFCSECHSEGEMDHANEVWRNCYDNEERIAFIRKHRDEITFHSFAYMLSCARGDFAPYTNSGLEHFLGC